MNRKYLSLILLFLSANAWGGNKIKYFFTQPVNTAVSKGVNAQYLNDRLGDTIVAYINRSKYTLDIAVYNYTSSFPAIAVAVNNAVNTRGVKVRWIYDSSSSNTGIPLLNSSVRRIASPEDAGSYSIMHNKFMIIDANSPDPADAIVWTGSSNWNTQQFNSDYNNAVVLQDQPLAKAYRAHFNMMWGDTGMAPVPASAKFGQYKTDLGAHSFMIDGVQVELYFSPSDGVNNKILAAIGSANTDMYFGMSTFTHYTDASELIAKHNQGVYVAGIDDPSSSSSSLNATLSSNLGSKFKPYTGSSLYHNKFLIVDPSNKCSDPLVLTGSHNWTVSADTRNDENTLIIHDATAANIYYQSFHANFTAMGGSLTTIPDCNTGTSIISEPYTSPSVSPNPSDGNFTIKYHLARAANVIFELYDISGRRVWQLNNESENAGGHTHNIEVQRTGMYFFRSIIDADEFNQIVTVN